MYLNAFNNDLIPREGFLSLNNLPTVVCCRQVYKRFALFYVDIRAFPFNIDRFKVSCFSMSTGLALVYVDRFN